MNDQDLNNLNNFWEDMMNHISSLEGTGRARAIAALCFWHSLSPWTLTAVSRATYQRDLRSMRTVVLAIKDNNSISFIED